MRASDASERNLSPVDSLVSRVFEAFDAGGMLWLLMPRDVDAEDLQWEAEVLVHRGSAGKADAILRTFSFVRVASSHGGAHSHYIGFEQSAGRWIRLHITTELAFGRDFEFRADVSEACLARRRVVDGTPALAPLDAFWVLLLRAMLQGHAFRRTLRSHLAELSRHADADTGWSTIVARVCPRPWNVTRVVAAASRGDWKALTQFAPRLEARWTRVDRFRVSRRRAAAGMGRVVRMRSPFDGRPGLSVALLGTDGTGKSTVIASILRSFPFPARTVYMGLWQRPLRRMPPPIPGWDLLGRLIFAWRGYLVGGYHRARRRLVLFDRYTYDAFLALGGQQGPKERLYFSLLGRSCPAPDAVFLLDVPGHVAFARKGEHDVAQLDAARRGFLALRSRVPAIQIIDASQPADVVRNEVVARIWRCYSAKWGK